MSFGRKETPAAAPTPEPVAAPNPADTENRIANQRRRRLASGGVQSTFLGSLAGILPTPTATLTGLNGGK